MARGEELTDEQWAVIEPHLPELPSREDGRGRPWRGNREVMNGILWILRSGARWKDLPARFPPYQTCHRRFQQWSRDGTLRRVLEALAEDLRAGSLPEESVEWLKTNFFKTELELGHCLRLPREGPCECDLYLSCAKFVTTREYAPEAPIFDPLLEAAVASLVRREAGG